MKEGFDKEIDSLMRRLTPGASAGSRPRGLPHASSTGVASHLDADELSAFAEGSLPAAARAGASAHLADCDECRGLVVSLARAAGIEGEIEKRAAVPALGGASSQPSRLRVWLAALLAPRALRYVAPALALCLVAVISFVALRSRRADERLARIGESSAPRASITKDQNSDTDDALQTSSNVATNANISAPSLTTNSTANHGAAQANTVGAANQPAKESPSGSTSSSAATDRLDTASEPPPPPKDAPATAPAEKKAENEADEATRAGEQPKPAQTVETETVQPQPSQRPNLSRNEMQQQSPDGSRNQTRSVNGAQSNATGAGSFALGGAREDRARAGAATTAPAPGRRSSDDKRAKSAEGRDTRNDDEIARGNVETRSVAGHSFRREGGAWVDTHYKSSMSSTGVRRGTDAYHALVADIPELGRVAEQLDGEVVVVIRGRAYRIR